MQMAQLVRILGRNDAKFIWRDRFLLFMFGFVLYIAVVLRYGLPWLNTYLAESGILPGETITSSLADYYPLIVVFMTIFQGGLMAGTIFGFMLLDEKDDNTIKAMLVTPVSLDRYVLYRIGMPTILSFFIIIGMVLFINQSLIPLWPLLLISLGASLTAPIAALFYAIFAENKVQGFAYGKFVGIAGWVIIIGWFVSEPWQWLFGLFPPFLVSKAYWMVLEGESLWWLALLIGTVLQAAVILLLVRLFEKVAHR